MALADAIREAMRTGGPPAAQALVEARAAAADPEALMMVGQWRLYGIYGPRDAVAGYAAIRRAADAGSVEAGLVAAALLATGTGTPRDIAAAERLTRTFAPRSDLARRQLAIAAMMDGPPPPRTILRADPMVARIDGLLPPAACAHLMAQAGPLIRPSLIVDPRTGERRPNPVRDSHGGNFAPPDEDIAIHAINRRIAVATGTDWVQGEPLHILRYQPGQQYRPHVDTLPGVANQRVLTVLIYLNDDYDGGETAFDGGLAVRGRVGDAVIFANTDPHGRADPRTRHAGLPVTHGTKWLATRWIRAVAFDPWAG